jgi:hypothetical protein
MGYGSLIYENMGTLRILIDGMLMEELDLADLPHYPEDAMARREESEFLCIRPDVV